MGSIQEKNGVLITAINERKEEYKRSISYHQYGEFRLWAM